MKIDFVNFPFDILNDEDTKRYLQSFDVISCANNIGKSIIGKLIFNNSYVSVVGQCIGVLRSRNIQKDFNVFMENYAHYFQEHPDRIIEELQAVMLIVANMVAEENEQMSNVAPIMDAPRFVWGVLRNLSVRGAMEDMEMYWEEQSATQAQIVLLSSLIMLLHCRKYVTLTSATANWIDAAVVELRDVLKWEYTMHRLCQHEFESILPYAKHNIDNSWRNNISSLVATRHTQTPNILSIIRKYGFIVSQGKFV